MPKAEPTESQAPEAPETPEAPQAPKPDLDYVLKQIEAIQASDSLLRKAMDQIVGMGPQDAAKIGAIQEMVTAREDTNRQLLSFYKTLYRDAKGSSPEMEWAERFSRGAERTAEKAGKTAREWGGKMKDFFQTLSEEGKEAVGAKAGKEPLSLKEKVLQALRDPVLDEESRALILDTMAQLKAMSPAMQDQALDILTDPALDCGEKSRILEKLDAIAGLDD